MHYNYAFALQKRGQLKEAIGQFNKAIEIKPKYSSAYNNRGLALLALGKIDESIASFTESLRVKPGGVKAINNLGMALKQQGKIELAIEKWKKALAINPDYANAHLNLGMTLVEQGKYKEAERHFNKVLEQNPLQPMVYYQLAIIYHKQNKLNLIVENCTKALLLKPDFTEVRINLARTLFRLGEIRSALEQYYVTLKFEPNQINALSRLAWILATTKDTALRNAAGAVKYAEKACKLTGYKQPHVLEALAVAYAAAGRFSEATEIAERAVRLAVFYGNQNLAVKIQKRMELYKENCPYHEPVPAKDDVIVDK